MINPNVIFLIIIFFILFFFSFIILKLIIYYFFGNLKNLINRNYINNLFGLIFGFVKGFFFILLSTSGMIYLFFTTKDFHLFLKKSLFKMKNFSKMIFKTKLTKLAPMFAKRLGKKFGRKAIVQAAKKVYVKSVKKFGKKSKS